MFPEWLYVIFFHNGYSLRKGQWNSIRSNNSNKDFAIEKSEVNNLSGKELIGHFIFSGGVLEPEGTVEIKFRYKDLSKAMHRLDPVCKKIKDQMGTPEISRAERAELEKKMRAQEKKLMSVYHQVAVNFADLHDRAGRMQEKGVISVSLETSTIPRDFVTFLIIMLCIL